MDYTALKFIAELARLDVFVKSYWDRQLHCLRRRLPVSLATPAEFIGEKRLASALVLAGRMSLPATVVDRRSFQALILAAPIYTLTTEAMSLWQTIGLKIRSELKGYPPHQRPRARRLPFPSLWLTSATGMHSTKLGEYDADLICQFDDGIAVSFQVDFRAQQVRSAVRHQVLIDALALLLDERVLSAEIAKPSRQLQRQNDRQGATQPRETITFLRLRQPSHRELAEEGVATATAFHHRWLVRGHIRNQWFPSRQCHELKWIASHIKGPDDAPFLERVRTAAH